MIDSIVNCSDFEKADAIILSAPYDATYSLRKGSELGPDSVIEILHKDLEFFDRFTLTEPAYLFKIANEKLKGINELSPEKMVNIVKETYVKYPKKFVVMLGGNHSVSIGALSFFATELNPKDVTILQIDAHLDLRDDTADYKDSPSKFDHACVMRRAYDFGFNTVQVGIRTYGKDEYEFSQEKNLKVFEWGRGSVPTIKSIIDSIETKLVYLTIDMDGLDPSCAPGTGTPVPGGIKWDYMSELLRELFESKDIIGADIVEIAPTKDDVLTPYSAAQLVYSIISYKLLKNTNKLKFISK
ncbi:MAG: agmatinase [Candidatus Moranbacteria bacterium]|nr:agmatinase [Candidatus Moranbacteria bacterium]